MLGCGLWAAGAQDGVEVDGKWPRCTCQPLPRWDIWALIKRIRNKPNKSLLREETEKKIGQKKIHHGGTPHVQRQTVVHNRPTSSRLYVKRFMCIISLNHPCSGCNRLVTDEQTEAERD